MKSTPQNDTSVKVIKSNSDLSLLIFPEKMKLSDVIMWRYWWCIIKLQNRVSSKIQCSGFNDVNILKMERAS